MHVRPGIPYIDPPGYPDTPFTGHGYSELVATGFLFTVSGNRIDVMIPRSVSYEQRKAVIENLKQLGFNGLKHINVKNNKEVDYFEVTVVVE